ncbi:MAG: transcription elongation factor GreAB [Myxococcota bacterium]
MTKKGLIAAICAALERDVEIQSQAAQATYDGATSEESKAEHQYDTRALEASYLAGAQARRAAETREALTRFAILEVKDFADGRPIAVGALVELDGENGSRWYFIGPCSGGLAVTHSGHSVLIITPAAPLGRALLGGEEGDTVTVGGREYEISQVL